MSQFSHSSAALSRKSSVAPTEARASSEDLFGVETAEALVEVSFDTAEHDELELLCRAVIWEVEGSHDPQLYTGVDGERIPGTVSGESQKTTDSSGSFRLPASQESKLSYGSNASSRSGSSTPIPLAGHVDKKKRKETQTELVAEAARAKLFRFSEGHAHQLLREFQSNSGCKREGFCLLDPRKPSKANAYIQISYAGANKLMCLQEFLLLYNGIDMDYLRARSIREVVEAGEDASKAPVLHASHLCGNPTCLIPDHICVENAYDNNQRKNCLVWLQCQGHSGCSRWHFICQHNPPCVKAYPGLDTAAVTFELARTRLRHRRNSDPEDWDGSEPREPSPAMEPTDIT